MGTHFAAISFDAALSSVDVPIAGVESHRDTKFVPARFIMTARTGSCVGPPASSFLSDPSGPNPRSSAFQL
jgi:hypothetical protein